MPLQGGYVAKRCPVRAQWDIVRPATPAPASEFDEMRFQLGRDFEQRVFAALTDSPDVRVVTGGGPLEREAATARAMVDGVPLIVGGRLPRDEVGRRVGEPDLLVRQGAVAVEGRWRYLPADVKAHRTTGGDRNVPAPTSTLRELRTPDVASATVDGRVHRADLLQLAHYWRMLEACGHAPDSGAWGAIVGKEEQLVWFALDQPLIETPAVTGRRRKKRTVLEVYDFEFAFRLDVIAAARDHVADPSQPLLVVPVNISECPSCPWRDHCLDDLYARDDVSLLPGVGWPAWQVHRTHDIASFVELAALDPVTARLVARGVNVTDLLDRAAGAGPDLPLEELIGRRKAQLAALADEGLTRVADLGRIHAKTASYADVAPAGLPEQIDNARARLHPSEILRRRGVGAVEVPRADVEVDIDMENTPDDAVYMWGLLVTDHTGTTGITDGYESFVTWERDAHGSPEQEVFRQFWQRLAALRRHAADNGLTFAAYCWNASAENRRLRELGAAIGVEAEVAAFISSDEWVDLLRVFDRQLITGRGSGLKNVARATGFEWRDAHAGGDESLVWWTRATDPATPPDTRDATRQRALAYNEDDVRATRAVRDWMSHHAEAAPHVDDPWDDDAALVATLIAEGIITRDGDSIPDP